MTNFLPSIRAKMGDLEYFITKMKHGDVAEKIKFAHQIHPNSKLDEQIQRELTSRVEEMKEFLLHQEQRFYGAIVVAVYGGSPKFYPVEIHERNDIVDEIDNSFGLLKLDGTQTYFALDGQHRVASIKAACEENYERKKDEISVILIAHHNTDIGLQRTRRLFSRLNRYAKPPNIKTSISIDEDDAVAIITRRLIREEPFFKDCVKIAAGVALHPKSDSSYLFTLTGFYKNNEKLLHTYRTDIEINAAFKKIRPDEDTLETMYTYILGVWRIIFQRVPDFESVSNYKSGSNNLFFDRKDGGSIWYRPVTQEILIETIIRSLSSNSSGDLKDIVDKLNRVPNRINDEPWLNILYDPQANKMINLNKKDHIEFFINFIGKSLKLFSTKISISQVEKQYTSLLKSETKRSLPKF